MVANGIPFIVEDVTSSSLRSSDTKISNSSLTKLHTCENMLNNEEEFDGGLRIGVKY